MSEYYLKQNLKSAIRDAKKIGMKDMAEILEKQLKKLEQLPCVTFEEVRYGNLVTYNENALCEVILPEKNRCTIHFIKDENRPLFTTSYQYIFPVRLNRNILENNGWKKNGNDQYEYSNNGFDLFLTSDFIFDDNSFEDMYLTIGDYNFGTIKYYHELQNIMWALKI